MDALSLRIRAPSRGRLVGISGRQTSVGRHLRATGLGVAPAWAGVRSPDADRGVGPGASLGEPAILDCRGGPKRPSGGPRRAATAATAAKVTTWPSA